MIDSNESNSYFIKIKLSEFSEIETQLIEDLEIARELTEFLRTKYKDTKLMQWNFKSVSSNTEILL